MEIKAVKRYLKDREREDLFFDVDLVEKRMKAAEILKHTKDRFNKQKFHLLPYQRFIIANLFGFYWKSTGRRRFKLFYFDISRKNGKTEFAVLLTVLLWYFENVPGAELYFAATKKDQARIGFDMFKIMLTYLKGDSKKAEGDIKILAHEVKHLKNYSICRPVSADHNSLDGLNPLVYLIDEYHAHKTSGVFKVMKSGTVSRENPMGIITTTAGFDKQKPCFKFRLMCDEVLSGIKTDDSLFAMVFAMDKQDDHLDPKNWCKSNPSMGRTLELETLKEEQVSAENEGAVEVNNFLTKNLNVWTSSAFSFISDKVWMRNSAEPTPYKDMPCWAGLDMSSNRDLTCFCLLFEDGSVLPFFFCPKDKIESRGKAVDGGVDYLQWHKDGHIIAIPGESIDHRIVKRHIIELHDKYDIRAVLHDPWHTRQIATELTEDGYEMLEMAQSYRYTTEAVKNLETQALAGGYKHGGHPILRWNNENALLKLGNNDGRMLTKDGESKKIDGMVALQMAEYGRTVLMEESNEYSGSGPVKL